MWQLTFAAKQDVLSEIDHTLRVDESVLRWIVQKRKYLDNLPNTHRVSKMAQLVDQPAVSVSGSQAA